MKNKEKEKEIKHNDQHTVYAEIVKTSILIEEEEKAKDDIESKLQKEEKIHADEGSNMNPPPNKSRNTVFDGKEKDKLITSSSKKNYVKTDDWYDTLDDKYTFPYYQILYKNLKRNKYELTDEINTYFDKMQSKYDLRGIRFLKEKNNHEVTIFVKGHFKENADFKALLQETPEENKGLWFADETNFNNVKQYYDTIYKCYLPPEENRDLEENDDSMKQDEVIKNVFDIETSKPKDELNLLKEKEYFETLKSTEIIAKERSKSDPNLILYREILMTKNEEIIIERIKVTNNFEEYETMTFMNELGKEVKYLKAQFTTEKSKSNALTKSDS
ncbi:hypothetical protein RclHR1_01410012 [Rhizophagus clarus]|uniref:Uncharacterized protein n=1 Tax=Rhizophagus clarus TaxID=94130 RepID=A0A2Z6QP57_9GLOM|nr:hypothetical protein RclHR1_01410012 [Rhizophagus clarus]GES74709.1 hypothetical protein RCL_jg10281.t1 [Rhizophagus clarus]